MAKRRNSPALFELLRDQSASAQPVNGAAATPPVAPAATGGGAVAIAEPPVEKPAAPATPTAPTREPKPLSDEPSIEIETPRFVAEPVRVAPGTPEMPDLTNLEPEPVVTRGDDGRVSFSLPVGMLAAIVGGAVVVLVLFGTSLYSLGSHASKEELKPIISDEANRALGDADAGVSRELIPSEPPREVIADSQRDVITPEQPVLVPAVEDPEPAAEDEAPAVAEAEEQVPEPTGPSNVDTRVPGLNYMYTSRTFDRDEALRAQRFLFENGIDSLVEQLVRESDGQVAYRLWTLVGIPGQGFNTSREKFDHERAMFDLGNEWLTTHGGRLDFSRKNQIGWIKYGG